ncbi:hypothetical protein ACFOSV_14955 [Algoriphagus namhaensis]|uniref:Uncharacterized protein n=1 Tax=Algoriphagus namhaensis TaxID=915353 RepID=A0ABV8AX88_9BACT
MIERLAEKATIQQLFWIDAVGAFTTSVLIFGLLIPFQEWFGMPAGTLKFLGTLAVTFFAYSLVCALSKPKDARPFLRLVAIANTCYVALTLVMLLTHIDIIAVFGWLYFSGECTIVLSLALVEYQKSKIEA